LYVIIGKFSGRKIRISECLEKEICKAYERPFAVGEILKPESFSHERRTALFVIRVKEFQAEKPYRGCPHDQNVFSG
jgi:hypothetical protein